MKEVKSAKAIRKSGDLYDVYYEKTMDSDVPFTYLVSLVKAGFVVKVDQKNFKEKNEPSLYVLESN